jgi:hypothetical protein
MQRHNLIKAQSRDQSKLQIAFELLSDCGCDNAITFGIFSCAHTSMQNQLRTNLLPQQEEWNNMAGAGFLLN